MNLRFAYNALIGRTMQNTLKALVCTYYQAMKFLTPKGVGVVRIEQRTAQQCSFLVTKDLSKASATVCTIYI